MSNMSYCRFQNTYNDLVDCNESIEEKCSIDESFYRKKLINLCKEVANDYIDRMSELPVED